MYSPYIMRIALATDGQMYYQCETRIITTFCVHYLGMWCSFIFIGHVYYYQGIHHYFTCLETYI